MKRAMRTEGFVFFPNPATSILHIDVNDQEFKNTFDVHIFDGNGNFVKGVRNPFYNNIAIKVDDLDPGFYTLTIENESKLMRNFVVR